MAQVETVKQPFTLGSFVQDLFTLGGAYLDYDTQVKREAEAEARARAEEAKLAQQTGIAGQLMPQMAAWGNQLVEYTQNPLVRYGGIIAGVGIAATIFMLMKKK